MTDFGAIGHRTGMALGIGASDLPRDAATLLSVRDGSACALDSTESLPAPSVSPTPQCSPANVAGGSVRARFRAMYVAHVDFVWRNLRRLGVSQADADDKAQEVFVIAHRRFGEFEEKGHGPRAWLFQIVLRVASEARRHRRRHPEDPDGGDAVARERVDPPQAQAVARGETLARLDLALQSIPLERRAVLLLHEIEELTAPEIAQSLSIPLNTVYSRLRAARIELQAALAETTCVERER